MEKANDDESEDLSFEVRGGELEDDEAEVLSDSGD